MIPITLKKEMGQAIAALYSELILLINILIQFKRVVIDQILHNNIISQTF